MTQIKFGTDGWRARIAEDYTFENVRRVIHAFAHFLGEKGGSKTLYVGYDRRFLSKEFAQAAVENLVDHDFEVHLSNDFCPTPCISWLVKENKAAAGVVITASHNPFDWNGIKFKESYGGSASSEYCQAIEGCIEKQKDILPSRVPFEKAREKIAFFDPHKEYLQQLKKMVDLKKIQKAGWKIATDPLYGSGSGYFRKLLGEQVHEIHGEENPNFGGLNPEPNAKNLSELMDVVRRRDCDIGLATDGDADRIGAVDEKGQFVDSHHCFSLILKHLIEVKQWPGEVVTTVSTTNMVKEIAKKHGRRFHDMPVGFKNICKKLQEIEPLIAGEESGGIAVCKHVYERDGLLSGLMLLEIMTHHQKTLSELVQDLHKEMGPHFYMRNDLHLSESNINRVRDWIQNNADPKTIGKFKVKRVDRTDGLKFYFEDESWLLIRASGTEPLLRLYVESPSQKQVQEIMSAGKTVLPL